jgi:hypothetical protein
VVVWNLSLVSRKLKDQSEATTDTTQS